MRKVSVVIPAYKAESLIIKAVTSALSQGERIGEVIVVIDGRFDDTESLLERIQDKRLKVIVFPENQGVQIARNTGLRKATGDYIIFLDSDDYFEGELIKGMASILDEGNADFALATNCSIDPKGVKNYFRIPQNINRHSLLLGRILSTMAVGIQCILWRRNLLEKIGGWDEDVSRNQDGELVIRALIYEAEPCVSDIGAGCSVQHDGERVSKRRTLRSFNSQSKIFDNVSSYLIKNNLSDSENKKLRAALNFFCINICIGMSKVGFVGFEYHEWKSRIQWKPSHFFLLPKNKAFQSLLFFIFGKKAYFAKRILKILS